MPYPGVAGHVRHPSDMSVSTFAGHSVLQTLIRCRFSPLHTTNQRYAYTGSARHTDVGKVCIYDLHTGEMLPELKGIHTDTVRDVSWHEQLPLLASAGWDGKVGLWTVDKGDARDDEQEDRPPIVVMGYGDETADY